MKSVTLEENSAGRKSPRRGKGASPGSKGKKTIALVSATAKRAKGHRRSKPVRERAPANLAATYRNALGPIHLITLRYAAAPPWTAFSLLREAAKRCIDPDYDSSFTQIARLDPRIVQDAFDNYQSALLGNMLSAGPLWHAHMLGEASRFIVAHEDATGIESIYTSTLQSAGPFLSAQALGYYVNVWERYVRNGALARRRESFIYDASMRTVHIYEAGSLAGVDLNPAAAILGVAFREREKQLVAAPSLDGGYGLPGKGYGPGGYGPGGYGPGGFGQGGFGPGGFGPGGYGPGGFGQGGYGPGGFGQGGYGPGGFGQGGYGPGGFGQGGYGPGGFGQGGYGPGGSGQGGYGPGGFGQGGFGPGGPDQGGFGPGGFGQGGFGPGGSGQGGFGPGGFGPGGPGGDLGPGGDYGFGGPGQGGGPGFGGAGPGGGYGLGGSGFEDFGGAGFTPGGRGPGPGSGGGGMPGGGSGGFGLGGLPPELHGKGVFGVADRVTDTNWSAVGQGLIGGALIAGGIGLAGLGAPVIGGAALVVGVVVLFDAAAKSDGKGTAGSEPVAPASDKPLPEEQPTTPPASGGDPPKTDGGKPNPNAKPNPMDKPNPMSSFPHWRDYYPNPEGTGGGGPASAGIVSFDAHGVVGSGVMALATQVGARSYRISR